MVALRKLSFWAKDHKWQSWFIIAIIHFFLVVSAVFLANAAFFTGLSLNLYSLFVLIGIIVITFAIYPKKNTKSYTFKNRKRADFALLTSGFLLVFSLFNVMVSEYEQKTTTTNPNAIQTILKPIPSNFGNESRLAKIRKRVKRKAYQKTQKLKVLWETKNEISKAFLITLALATTIFLGLLVTYLGAGLGSSGSTAAITLIFILGYGGIIVAAFFAIREVLRGRTKKTQ